MLPFSNFFYNILSEAKHEDIEEILPHIHEISKRPFNELFKDKGDRFLIKVYNPTFEKNATALNLDVNKFDWKKREYDGTNINTFLKKELVRLKNLKPSKEDYASIKKTYNYALRAAEKFNWDNPKLCAKNAAKNQYVDLMADGGHYHSIKYNGKKHIAQIKQTIDQNNIYYYLLFSRHPMDVLRMSDHKGISSCHRLDGGTYKHCAIADAKNDGGIVYLLNGKAAKQIKDTLQDKEIFKDKDRPGQISNPVQPLGRIRLRRFIDNTTGKDFAVPSLLLDEQKYGKFTQEVYDTMLHYIKNHQPSIIKNPPTNEYAQENIIVVGGIYTDTDFAELLSNFLNQHYSNIQHKNGTTIGWHEEMTKIVNLYNNKITRGCDITYNIINNNIILNLDLSNTLLDWKNFPAVTSDKRNLIINNLKNDKAFLVKTELEISDLLPHVYDSPNTNSLTFNNYSDSLHYEINIQFQMSDPHDSYNILDRIIEYKSLFKIIEFVRNQLLDNVDTSV